MANIGGPLASSRKLFMDPEQSIPVYGAEIWADTMSVKHRLKVLANM